MTATDKPETAVDREQFAADFGLSILRVARAIRLLGIDEELSETQKTALAMIEHYRSITLGELAVVESIARPTASAVVNRLEELGFVRRVADPLDGRVWHLEATRAGQNYLRTTRMRRAHWLLDRIETYTDDEIASLNQARRLLDDLAEGADVMPLPPKTARPS